MRDGSWRSTGRTVNATERGTECRLVEFGGNQQAMGAFHSHGAMLMRSIAGQIFETPSDWPLAAIEVFRERMMQHPLLYIPEPLAAFAVTARTARNEGRREWAVAQSFSAATFIKHLDPKGVAIKDLVSYCRASDPPTTNTLIFSAIIERSCRFLLRHLKTSDWLLFMRGVIRRPQVFWCVLFSRRRHRRWWQLLDHHTAQRFGKIAMARA